MAWSTVDIGAYKAAAGGGGFSVTPPTGSITATGYAPTVTATADQTVTPSAGSFSFAGLAPTVTASSAVASIVSVLPAAFDNGQTGIVVTVANIVTAGAQVFIGGVEQTVTGSDATTITFTAVRGSDSLGSAILTVVAA